MDNRTKWISTRIRLGWTFLAVGALVAAAGITIQLMVAYLPFNHRIITGVGILLAGIGVAYLVRYRAALKDTQSATRIIVEEQDERTVLIRARAGNRAYWVSAALVYAGLMWASFAANGGLPVLDGDALWYFLAAGVVIPFAVYIASIVIDQQNT